MAMAMASLVDRCHPMRSRHSSGDFDLSRLFMPVEAAMDSNRRRLHNALAGHPVSLSSKRRRDSDCDFRSSKRPADGRASSASAVAQLSCARIRPYVRASRPKEEKAQPQISAGDNAHVVIKKQNADQSISYTGTRAAVQAPRPTTTEASIQVGAGAVAHDVIRKQKTGDAISCTKTRPAVQASRRTEELEFSSGGSVLRHGERGVIKKQQESAGERVQATPTTNILPLAHLEPPSKPQGPFAAEGTMRAALAAARQALIRRQREEARRELDKVVQTVYFNDPNMTLENLLKAQALIGSC